MPADYLEIKRHKNKPEQQFACELLHREPGYAVLCYSSNEPGLIADIRIAPQATTIAHYWQNRSYVVWRMFDCSGCLIGTLFHICSDVCIHARHLSYDDLLLDIWIAPDNSLRILDEGELQECIDKGLINNAELRSIRQAQQNILSRHPKIIFGLTAFDCTPV
jgi:hypothetical protein